ncbi:hypothetical protein [Thalassovita sp.]|uniref:calcium-binding protein n=1 Tax=Thalassovita sp. TaxID=1979401 RepID=UPI002B2670A8|nr:hypothetical protein [Thalassovita sp.]
MATGYAFTRLNMDELTAWHGTVQSYDSSQFTVVSGNYRAQYTGAFSYDFYGNVYGELHGFSMDIGGTPQYSISGLDVDAYTAYSNYVSNNNLSALFELALSGADNLFGSTGSDLIRAYGGNDNLRGDAGNDTLYGGQGTDTAVFSGNSSSAVFDVISGGVSVSSSDGVDYLYDIERVRFSDGIFAIEEFVGSSHPEPSISTGNLFITSSTGWETGAGSTQTANTNATVYLGHAGGNNRMLRVEGGSVSVDTNRAQFSGVTVYSELASLGSPLFTGDFTLDLQTLSTTSFSEDVSNIDFGFANIMEIDFSSLTINQTEVAMSAGVSFPNSFWNLSTSDSLLSFTLTDTTIVPRFGTIGTTRLASADPFELDLPSSLERYDLEFSDLSFSYDYASDSLYFGGRAALSIDLLGSTRQVEIDLAGNPGPTPFDPGDRFLRFSGIGDGTSGFEWDIVSEMTYSIDAETDGYGTSSLFAPSWGLRSLSIELDTIANRFAGSVAVELPFLNGFEIEGSVEFFWDPFELDAFSFDVDGLNTPIFNTGAFLQGFTGDVSGLATALSSDPVTYTGSATASLGPRGSELLFGTLDGSYSDRSLDVLADISATGRYLLPDSVVSALEAGQSTGNRLVTVLNDWMDVDLQDILDYEILGFDGSLSFDIGAGEFEFDGQIDILGGLISLHTQIEANRDFDFMLRSTTALTWPERIPLVGGSQIAGVDFMVDFSNDGNLSNDFAAFWTGASIDLGVISGSVSIGFQIAFDGDFEILGAREIQELNSNRETMASDPNPEIMASAPNAFTSAFSGWALTGSMDLVLLTAQWSNAVSDASLVLIGPDGSQYDETDIASLSFAQVIDVWSDGTSRSIILDPPEAGNWSLRVESATDLTNLSFNALETANPASVEITNAQADSSTGILGVDVDVSGLTGASQLNLYLASDPSGANAQPILLEQQIAQSGQFHFDVDVTDIPPGQFHVVAMVGGNGIIPAIDEFATPISFAGGVDITVSIDEGLHGEDGRQVFTFTVENINSRTSQAATLTIAIAEGAQLLSNGIGTFDAAENELTIDLGILASGASSAFALEFGIPDTLDGGTVEAQVSSDDFDLDSSNDSQSFALGTAEVRQEASPAAPTEFADVILATDFGDNANGLAGDDTLRGGDNPDTLIGGNGDDIIFGGETAADLRDNVYGGNGNDSIDGGYGNDELRGDADNDTIVGGYGVDTIVGGTGDDQLTGQAWSDLVFGGDGADFVNGGFGHDRVNGGDGADRFFHIGIFDHGSDWIQDYSASEGDVLVFGGSGTPDQFQINFVETANAGEAGVEEAFVIYRPTGQILWALVDGGAQTEINLMIGGAEYDLLA